VLVVPIGDRPARAASRRGTWARLDGMADAVADVLADMQGPAGPGGALADAADHWAAEATELLGALAAEGTTAEDAVATGATDGAAAEGAGDADPLVWCHPALATTADWWCHRARCAGYEPRVVVAWQPPEAVAASADGPADAGRRLARWELAARLALATLTGLPCTVERAGAGPAGPDDPRGWAGPTGAVLAEQQQLAELLSGLVGSHDALPAVPLAAPSGWTTALAETERRLRDAQRQEHQAWMAAAASAEEGAVLWRALWQTAGRLADSVAASLPHPVAAWGGDATTELHTYLRWIREREQPAGPPGSAIDTDRRLADGPVVSVVVPVYHPDPALLRSAVASVRRQTYPRWELCLCDDGTDDPAVTALLDQLAKQDPRVRVTALARNGGISAATNQALAVASGQWVAFMDQDDELAPDALAAVATAVIEDPTVDLVYTDDDKIDREGRRFGPQFKPDWDPDLLLAMCYFSHLVAMRRSLVDEVGGLRSSFDGSQDWDLALRVSERARTIRHVPRVLYHWRAVPGSAAASSDAKPWAYEAARRVLADTLRRRGEPGTVDHHPRFRGLFHVRRERRGDPLVSVVVPFRDGADLLQRCVDSVVADPGHDRIELVLVDNGSTEPEMAALLDRLAGDDRVRVLHDPRPFNWAALNNAAIAQSRGDLVLTLNNDVTAASSGWLREMVVHAERPEIGAVGARLLYPDGRVQHVGTVVGLGGVVAHPMRGLPGDHPGYMGFATVARSWSAVTGACLLARRQVVEEVGGFDEALAVAFNDVDFCLRVGARGYRIVCTPLAELVHAESSTRGFTGYSRDIVPFVTRWEALLRGEDPMFSPNLSRFDARCVVRLADEDDQWNRHLHELGLS